jgi:putative heme utilization carrier protein HutX
MNECKPTCADTLAKVRAAVAEKPNQMLSDLAKEFNLSEGEVVCMLPEEMRVAAPAEDFEKIWQQVCAWEKATFIAINAGGVVEYSGAMPKGSFGHGMYNLHQAGISLGGHLFVNRLGSIWFLSKPHFGKESHSIQFYTTEGDPMFSVYVGRGEDKELLPSALKQYYDLRNSYAGGAA